MIFSMTVDLDLG